MKIVSIKQELMDIPEFQKETEFRGKDGSPRPFVVVVRLKYKEENYLFAIPIRSNIQVNDNTKGTYFPLPTRDNTKPNRAHGIHYIKIMPVHKNFFDKYNKFETPYYKMLYEYIDNNESKIVSEAQNYLFDYEKGTRKNFCTDIDEMIVALKSIIGEEEKSVESTNADTNTDRISEPESSEFVEEKEDSSNK